MERSIEMRRLQDSVSHPGVRRIASFFSHPERSRWGLTGVIAVVALTITLTACGDDSSTSVNDDESSSSVVQSSSSITLSGASAKSNGSSDGKKVSSSAMKNSASSSSVTPDSVPGLASSSSGVQPVPNKFSKNFSPYF